MPCVVGSSYSSGCGQEFPVVLDHDFLKLLLVNRCGFHVFGGPGSLVAGRLCRVAEALGAVVFGGSSSTWDYSRHKIPAFCEMFDAVVLTVFHTLKSRWIGLSS